MEKESDNLRNFHTCDLCHYMTKSLLIMHRHLDRHERLGSNPHQFYCISSTPEVYECGSCDFQTVLKVSSTEHQALHEGREVNGLLVRITDNYNCKNCCFNTHSLLVLTKHVLNCNQELQSKNVDLVKSPKEVTLREYGDSNWFQCEKCSHKYKLFSSLKRHIRLKHCDSSVAAKAKKQTRWKIKWYECDRCSYRTKRKFSLKSHNLHIHTSPEEINWFQCYNCSFKAKTKSKLKHHVIRRHVPLEELKWFRCDKCSYKTKFKLYLNRHLLRKHAGPKEINWFECDKCSFKTKWKHSLKDHNLYRHTRPEEINWFHCDNCTYKAKFRERLKRHVLRRHTPRQELNWFRCVECSYKSKFKHDLNRHNIVKHTRQKR